MLLEREQWHYGYTSLLRTCRSPHDTSTAIGRALLLVHPDSTDALATSRILSYMLRADGVPYQIRPCLGFERLKIILRGVGVLQNNNSEYEDDTNNVIEEEVTNTSDVRAVVLINMGASRNLTKLFTANSPIRAYVIDNHRPYHLANIHSGKNVVLFNDRPLEEEEVVSDGDNLSGDESSSSSESDDDDESSEEENEERDEGEQEFELEDEGGEREVKRRKIQRADGDSDDDDDDDNAGGDNFKKGRDDDQNPLDTTAATADMTLTSTQDDDSVQNQSTTQQQQQQQQPTISLRELHRQRRNRIRLHYSSGSYHASPSSWTAYTLSTQLRFGDTPDLLWLACVGVTDAYLHGRLDVSGYSALTVDLKRHVGRLFPNELVDRAGRAVYAEDLERGFNNINASSEGEAMTQISLSENGRILSQPEYKFMLLRHTTLWESILHSNFVASKMQVWKQTGRQKLMELLAKMGFPLDQCRQPWAFVSTGMRKRLSERLEECTEVRGLLFCF